MKKVVDKGKRSQYNEFVKNLRLLAICRKGAAVIGVDCNGVDCDAGMITSTVANKTIATT